MRLKLLQALPLLLHLLSQTKRGAVTWQRMVHTLLSCALFHNINSLSLIERVMLLRLLKASYPALNKVIVDRFRFPSHCHIQYM